MLVRANWPVVLHVCDVTCDNRAASDRSSRQRAGRWGSLFDAYGLGSRQDPRLAGSQVPRTDREGLMPFHLYNCDTVQLNNYMYVMSFSHTVHIIRAVHGTYNAYIVS